MDDYIPLGPDETIREGDIFDTPNRTFVMPVIGSKASDYPNLRLKRPRSTVIRDAAIDLLWCFYCERPKMLETEPWPPAEALRLAVGVSVEDLRKQA